MEAATTEIGAGGGPAAAGAADVAGRDRLPKKDDSGPKPAGREPLLTVGIEKEV
jgi:hypothetical protein